MKKKSILFIFSSLLIFSGCTATTTVQKETKSTTTLFNIIKTSQVPTDYLEYSEGKKEFLVYHSDTPNDVKAFETEYEKLTNKTAPKFQGNMIIAKSGTKSSGGYSISIESVKDSGRFTEVTLLSKSPGRGCFATTALENPYIIVEIPDNYKDIKFVEKSVLIDCE